MQEGETRYGTGGCFRSKCGRDEFFRGTMGETWLFEVENIIVDDVTPEEDWLKENIVSMEKSFLSDQ